MTSFVAARLKYLLIASAILFTAVVQFALPSRAENLRSGYGQETAVERQSGGAAPVQVARLSTAKKQAAKKQRSYGAYPYYVEFRSRYALSYGHTFLAHGRLGAGGKIISQEIAGLHPAGDDPSPWVLGHFVPVKSDTGASDGDTEEQYISARYRINLTAEQYAVVVDYIRKLQASSPVWHAVWYNCNAFVGDVAHRMGLKAPGSMAMPADYINGIRALNGGISTLSGTPGQYSATVEMTR